MTRGSSRGSELVPRPRRVASFYDRTDVVSYYESSDALTPSEHFVFESYLSPGMDIVDIGVGAGRTAPYLSALARGYVGLDIAPAMVARCRERFPELQFIVGDATDLCLRDGSCDAVVFSANGFDHLDSETGRARCLEECRRVLRTGGVLVYSRHNARATGTTLRTVIRAAKRPAFWWGEGYVTDHTHGGLITHTATPARVRRATAAAGFEVLATLGPSHPGGRCRMFDPWFYYVARKPPCR